MNLSSKKIIKILFLIRSLEQGGAEHQLVQLVKSIDKKRFEVFVVTFYEGGLLESEVKNCQEVTLLSLHKQERWEVVTFLYRLYVLVKEIRPDILHSYMDGANIAGLLIGKLLNIKVVWGIRASKTGYALAGKFAWFVFRVGIILSRYADLIIVNSQSGKQYWIKQGHPEKRLVLIYNGINTERFFPDPDAGFKQRQTWGLCAGQKIVGLVARLDPMKDHVNFLQAAHLILKAGYDVYFICVGDGTSIYKQHLMGLTRKLQLADRVIWTGPLQDTPTVFNAFDVSVSSSLYEGSPNVVGEAMACGTPCVVTDVGDSAAIVENREQIVPPDNSVALAEAIIRLLELPSEAYSLLARNGRLRITENFGVQKMVSQTEMVLQKLVTPIHY